MLRVRGSVKNEFGERLSALRRPSGGSEKNWIREEGVGDEERERGEGRVGGESEDLKE